MDTRSPIALHWIGGHWTQSMGSAEAESIDPATGILVGRFAAGGAPEVQIRATAMRLFTWSITYITLLFAAMAIDQLVRSGW